jgi:hypothetical protein
MLAYLCSHHFPTVADRKYAAGHFVFCLYFMLVSVSIGSAQQPKHRKGADHRSKRVTKSMAGQAAEQSGSILASDIRRPGALLIPVPKQLEKEGLRINLEEKDSPLEAQRFYVHKRVPPGQTAIPVEKYAAALRHIQKMPRYSTTSRRILPPASASQSPATSSLDTPWTRLGPGNIGGRVRALLIDPGTPTTMYTAGVAGGVWKTVNGGASWSSTTDLIANLAVNSLAMDPNNSQVIYAGTGEAYFNGDAVRGNGIFKTTDGGSTWIQLTSTANNPTFYYVSKIAVSNVDSSHVYAAFYSRNFVPLGGVVRSLDGGSTWSVVLDANRPCYDLAMRTDQASDYIFASCGSFVQSTIYRNTDAAGSGTWSSVQTDPRMGLTSLAIAPSNQNVIYALASDNGIQPGIYQLGLLAVYRSTSSGDAGSWTVRVDNTNANQLNTLLLSNPLEANLFECGFGSSDLFFNQGWYDNIIAVDPVDPNKVWAGGVDLFRSDDGGQNWGVASYWWADPNLNSSFAHADQHAIVFHPAYNGTSNQTMFVGNDGGVFQTSNARSATAIGLGVCDPAASSITWTALNHDLAITQFYDGVAFPGGKTYFGGTQDNGTDLGSDAAGGDGWNEILDGDGGFVAVDPTTASDPNSTVLYAENTFAFIQKSTDGGKTFNPAFNGISDSGVQFITPFVMDPGNPQTLWTGGFFLWRTTNGARRWVQASKFLDDATSAIAVHPGNSNLVLAGDDVGGIYANNQALAANASTQWNPARPAGQSYVSGLAFDPANQNTAYAVFSTFGVGHIWKNTDVFGAGTWTNIDGSGMNAFPDIPAHSIVVDPFDSAHLYVGSDLGVFTTIDGGANWMAENTGFANAVTESLSIADFSGHPYLFAFTHGRGAWRVQIPNSIATTVALSSSANPALAGQSITFTASVTASDGSTPTGSVDFKDGTTTIATAQALDGSAVATYSTAALSAGPHFITAVYSGDANHHSTSSVLAQLVNNSADAPTTTGLAISIMPQRPGELPNTFEKGQTVTLTATVIPSPGTAGNVTFLDGATILGSASVTAGAASLELSNQLRIGRHNLRAIFSGGGGFQGSVANVDVIDRSPRPR